MENNDELSSRAYWLEMELSPPTLPPRQALGWKGRDLRREI